MKPEFFPRILSTVLLMTTLCHSKLAMVSLDTLIFQSDLIAIGSVESYTWRKIGSGVALLHVTQALRGTVGKDTIEISWTSEAHDQPIDEKGRYVLFLKRLEGNKYTGTIYGRSYWKIETTTPGGESIPYISFKYPVNLIHLPMEGSLVGGVGKEFIECGNYLVEEGIYLTELKKYVYKFPKNLEHD
jgi:hypothetical protein